MIAADRTITPASALRTLLYLDAHILLNRMRTAARNPLRLIFWLIFILVILSSIQARTMMNDAIRSRPAPPPSAGPLPTIIDPRPWLHVAATFIPGIVLIIYGIFTIASSRQPLPAFRSAADARFLIGSALPPRLVVLWLVVRVILSLSWRIPMMLYFFIFILPASFGASAASGLGAFFSLLLLTATVALNLPIFISRKRRIGPNPALLGWLLVLTGLASVVVIFVALSPGPPSLVSTLQPVAATLPPGSWLVGAFEGNGPGLIALAALATGSLLLTWLVAGDVYPELWSSSARMIVLRRAVRRRGPFMTRSDQRQLLSQAGIAQPIHRRQTAAPSSQGRWVPSGAWTILWKEWLATRRVAGGMRLPAIALLVAVVVGAALGTLSRNRPAVAGALLGPLSYAVVMISLFTAYRLGNDLRKPIWWLSASTLRARLAVLLVARTLRLAIPISAGLLTAGVAGGNAAFLLAGAPIVVAATWAINSMALGTYAILPGSSDMRGPGGCLRVIVLFVMVIPIGIAGIVGGIATESGTGSLVAAVITALGEGWLLVLFAASQLDGNGLAFAQAERR
ncbi:MAG TPA: putative ABC exporter domain-containing protein [Candidatus Dormibacteraeota bacterium]|nr:putative ABC exporter domain-containing protein [Candidatus Dormibacteraeota bacterium]